MLQKMQVVTPVLNPPAFEFDDDGNANTDKIQIREITGLEPVNATINTTPYGSIAGAAYTGPAIGARNIVLTIGLNPDWDEYTMEDLRYILYNYFMPPNNIDLIFSTTKLDYPVSISGYVESIEPNIFSQDPEMTVSIICPDPDFVAVLSEPISPISGADSVVQQADAVDITFAKIAYEGSRPTSMRVQLEGTADATNYTGNIHIVTKAVAMSQFGVSSVPIKAQSTTTGGYIYFVVEADPDIMAADSIDTTSGAASYANMLNAVVDGSVWPQLVPGENYMVVSVNQASPNMKYSVAYTPRFGGL